MIARRPDIDRDSPQALQVLAGQEVEDAGRSVRTFPGMQLDHNGDRPCTLAQGMAQLAQHRQRHLQLLQAVAPCQRPLQARPVIGLILQ